LFQQIYFFAVASLLATPTCRGLLRGEAPCDVADDEYTNRELMGDGKCCCDLLVIDFDRDAYGKPVQPGTYAYDKWKSLGLIRHT
jgi:hypothetical protein